MGCVGAIVTTHDQEQVHRNVQQFAQRILPFLSGAADRIKEAEIFFSDLWSVSINHRLANSALHFLGLATQHRCLVSNAHSLEMHVRVETWRMLAIESFPERLFVAAVPDVIANVIGICESQDDHVMSAAVAQGA